jgi:acyl-coenzyme A synthetase/AMP-(fatty) acid ligase/pimeloyl-ACP methyl ester carboxylesterase
VSSRSSDLASLIPGDLPGLDPAWSRRLEVVDADQIPRTWHYLERPAWPDGSASGASAERAFSDHGRETRSPVPTERTSSDHGRELPASPIGTMLCLHGNPTWSYLWRRFLATAPPGWRVIAPDQLGMGWSERVDRPRTLAERIDDLGRLTDALGLTDRAVTGPVVAVAHDWGGPVLLGWAERHRELLAGIVLTNTGVALPADTAPPGVITLARSGPLLETVCARTPAFVRATTALSRPALPKDVRDAFASPYALPVRRRAVRDFVADIPLESGHPSRATLDGVVDGLAGLADLPALLVWGPRDPVFSIRYLHDLRHRLPRADVQLYPRASHLVVEDAPQAATDVWDWVQASVIGPPTETLDAAPTEPAGSAEPPEGDRPLWEGLLARANDHETAIAELGPHASKPISFADLERRVADLAVGLERAGVRPGQRVALLVRPGIDLTVAVYACWRVGAAIVVADAGLGLRNLGRALRSADPDHLIAIPAGLLAATALRIPGTRIVVGELPEVLRRRLRVSFSLKELSGLGTLAPPQDAGSSPSSETSQHSEWSASPEDEAAVLFTSGATGPAKGVVYRHRQLRAQLDLVRTVCDLRPGARLVAAFPPFALYGPALGAAAAVPDMDPTKPGTLTATGLAEAIATLRATVVFASPAALRNVAATAGDLTPELRRHLAGVRTLLSAGAPVPVALLREIQVLLPDAELHTPYGMTEALPATDITLDEIEDALAEVGAGADGVCVGRPLPGVRLALDPLDGSGRPTGALETGPQITGEICVGAAHVKDHYDRLWSVQQRSATPTGWHRTGDVGHLDQQGRLWVEGRLVHVITGPAGPVTPVGIEQRVQAVPDVGLAAAVGVGPAGTQQTVVVVASSGRRTGPLAAPHLAAAVRAAAGVPLAAVLVTDRLPVDIRHASKIDRARVARWAEHVLAGGRPAGRFRRP